MSIIGSRIKSRREELGLTQEELAQKLKYKSKSTIAKIEKGVNDIPQNKILEFAHALDTTPAYLMAWDFSTVCEEDREIVNWALTLPRPDAIPEEYVNFGELLNSIGYSFEYVNKRYTITGDYGSMVISDGELKYLKASANEYLDYMLRVMIRDKHIENQKSAPNINIELPEPEPPRSLLNAAHKRTDIEVTDEMRKHDDDIMDDENF